MTFADVAVIGAGTMGQGIAQLLVEAGLSVRLYDASPAALERAVPAIRDRLARRARRGAATLDPHAAAARLTTAAAMAQLGAVDLAIEAVPERLELKVAVFAALDAALPAQAVLASNTSGLDVAALAAATSRPERVLGLHFFNPPPSMPLVEVVPSPATDAGLLADVCAWVAELGKTAIQVANRPGFAVNRVLFAMVCEAIRALEDGVAPAADIDRALRLGASHPIGPLALADFVGLDVTLDLLESLSARLGPRYDPPARLRELVERGHLGRKAGRGFFSY